MTRSSSQTFSFFSHYLTIDILAKESHSHGWICKFSLFFFFFSHFQVSLWSSVLMCFWPCKCLGFAIGLGRNMSRIDFGWCFFENVEELLLFVFLHAWAWACVRSLHSCVCSSILAYVDLFLRLCVRGNRPTCARFCLCTWALTCVREMLGRSLTLLIFTYFSTISLPYAILTPFCHFCIRLSLYPSFYLHSCIKTSYFLNFTWIRNLMSPSSFLQSSSPYAGRGSTNKVVEWFNLLVLETRGYIQEDGFKPIIGPLLEKFASATLA